MQPDAPRATAVAVKLAETEALISELESGVAPLALAESEGVSGAKRDLQALEARIEAAKRESHRQRQAHRHAVELDRRAEIAAASAMRQEQFAVMKKCAAVRLKAAKTIMDVLPTLSAAYFEYVIATNEMVVALPTQTRMPRVAMGKNGYGGSWVGDLRSLLAAEAFRLTVIDDRGRGARLPFALQPELTSDDPGAITPAIDVFTEAQESVLRDIEAQMQRLNAEAMTAAAGEVAA